MTLSELSKVLKETGLPVAYSHFNTNPTLPYICYLVAYSSNFIADGKVFSRVQNVQVELYSDKKDLAAEQKLENVFDKYEIPFQSIENYISSENMFQVIYEITIL